MKRKRKKREISENIFSFVSFEQIIFITDVECNLIPSTLCLPLLAYSKWRTAPNRFSTWFIAFLYLQKFTTLRWH